MIKKLKTALLDEIKQTAWDNYFANATLEIDKNCIYYKGANIFTEKFVNTKYKDLIITLAKQVYKNDFEFRIKETKQKSNNQIEVKEQTFKKPNPTLIPSLNFDSFIVGDSNSFAYNVCKQVCDLNKFGKLFNPIFIYSSTGLGKTHLLHACGQDCQALGKKVVIKTSKTFKNDFAAAKNTNNWQQFNEQFADCELLLIDDVQFLGNTESIQTEFFHIFNDVVSRGGQIVMTSDVAPKDLSGMTDRLKSRFANGLIANINPPDLETKQAIVKKKCELYDIDLDTKIANMIASYLGKNIRDIEGVITTISATQQIINQKISVKAAEDIIREYINEQKENIEIEDIFKIVSDELSVKISDIQSANKSRKMVRARRVAIFLAKELLQNAVGQIAQSFKMKTHSNVSHHLKIINKMLAEDQEFFNICEHLKNKLLNKN